MRKVLALFIALSMLLLPQYAYAQTPVYTQVSTANNPTTMYAHGTLGATTSFSVEAVDASSGSPTSTPGELTFPTPATGANAETYAVSNEAIKIDVTDNAYADRRVILYTDNRNNSNGSNSVADFIQDPDGNWATGNGLIGQATGGGWQVAPLHWVVFDELTATTYDFQSDAGAGGVASTPNYTWVFDATSGEVDPTTQLFVTDQNQHQITGDYLAAVDPNPVSSTYFDPHSFQDTTVSTYPSHQGKTYGELAVDYATVVSGLHLNSMNLSNAGGNDDDPSTGTPAAPEVEMRVTQDSDAFLRFIVDYSTVDAQDYATDTLTFELIQMS